MSEQLLLVTETERRSAWRLDDATRERGRKGVEDARAVLAAARRAVELDEATPAA